MIAVRGVAASVRGQRSASVAANPPAGKDLPQQRVAVVRIGRQLGCVIDEVAHLAGHGAVVSDARARLADKTYRLSGSDWVLHAQLRATYPRPAICQNNHCVTA